jgi:hypothetical protein
LEPAQNAASLHTAKGGNLMDEKDTRNESKYDSAAEVESTTRDEKGAEESKEYESMIPV